MRTWGDVFFTPAERRVLRLMRIICAVRGHDDHWVEWWNHYVIRCDRCLTFVVQGRRA